MFKIGNSQEFSNDVMEKDKPLFGDGFDVSSTDLPFKE
jgi:hypothetical protein